VVGLLLFDRKAPSLGCRKGRVSEVVVGLGQWECEQWQRPLWPRPAPPTPKQATAKQRAVAPVGPELRYLGYLRYQCSTIAPSLAVSAGANVKAVQRMLGHASAAMTLDVYSGLFDDDLDGLADRMDAASSRARADSARTDTLVAELYGRRASP
jgi:hypothetical protein